MKTIKQVMEEFLKAQQDRLKPRTYNGYEYAIELFEDYLNGYAYQYLDEDDSKLFDKLYDEGDKEFCEIFGLDKIRSYEIGDFLDDFMIRKVAGSKDFMKTVGKVMRKFVEWMKEKGYTDEEEYGISTDVVDELKDELPEATELSDLIYNYIEDNHPGSVTETREGYFAVTKIKPGKLWLGGYMGYGKDIGPVIVSDEISSICKVGWTICLEIGRTSKGWEMMGSGNVYPR
ncbi:MAG: hypothetical protein C5S48_07010 [Candidatus Methanogaster sp.]|nr:MAG: hypothetical protein C5S48_07010 [ANME-2 cluster archaeon]